MPTAGPSGASDPSEVPGGTTERSTPAPSERSEPASSGEAELEPLVAPGAHPCAERAREHAVAEARRLEAAPDALEIGFEEASDPTRECASQALLPDLDGDGVEELDLQPTCGQWNKVWPHFLYLSRECRFAGVIVDAELERQETVTSGMRDLEATSSLGCAGLEISWNRYAWNGDAYIQVATADCCFCEPPEECALGAAPTPPVCSRLAERFGAGP